MDSARGLVVAALVTTLWGVGGCRDVPDPGRPTPVAPTAAGTQSVPSAPTWPGWRTERWRGVAVDVPAGWWYGGGPMRDSLGPLACFPEPIVDPAGERREGRNRGADGWVGRPIGLTDVCASLEATPPPRLPYLWFDAPVETGTVDLGDGWIQETVTLRGVRVTVATDDDALRRRILGTATGGDTCHAELDHLDDPLAPPPAAEGDRALVCAYRGSAGTGRLTYAAELPQARADRFVAAFATAPRARVGTRACDLGGADVEWVVVQVAGDTYVVRTGAHGCPHVQRGDRLARLTPALVEPWATGGIPAVVVGPTGGKGAMLEGFIGPQG